MSISKKMTMHITIFIIIFIFFVGCSKIINPIDQTSTLASTNIPKAANSNTNSINPTNNSGNVGTEKDPSILQSWIGNYTFSEYAPPDQNMFYTISIFKDFNDYNAKISIDGFQTIIRLQAKVIGDEKSIKLVFNEYLPDNRFETYNEGDILLSFKKRDSSEIYTTWGEIQPMLESNNKSSEVYFKIGGK